MQGDKFSACHSHVVLLPDSTEHACQRAIHALRQASIMLVVESMRLVELVDTSEVRLLCGPCSVPVWSSTPRHVARWN
jgi:hypothetical protein